MVYEFYGKVKRRYGFVIHRGAWCCLWYNYFVGLFSSKKPKIAIVFDVGSSSVGVAAIILSSHGKPKVVFSAREQMVFQEDLKFDRLVSSMLGTLEKVARTLERVALPPHSGKSFSVFFASPWYASQTRISKNTFAVPTLITDKLLHDIQEKEVEDFKAFEMKNLGKDAMVIERQNIQVKLNGYETSAPEGKVASTLQTSLYISIAPQKIVHAVKEKISGIFHNRSVSFYTFSFSSFAVVRDIFFHKKSFFSLDISGEVTDVSIVRDNVLQETRTFPKGKNFLLRKIALGIGAPYAEAFSYFTMAVSKKLTESESEKAKKIMSAAGKEWLSDLRGSLYELSRDGNFLPNDMFFAADEDVSEWFAENIEDQEMPEITIAEKTFTVRHLDAVFLSPFCESGQGVVRDLFLMIEAVFLAKLME
jgi:hypothetical protein